MFSTVRSMAECVELLHKSQHGVQNKRIYLQHRRPVPRGRREASSQRPGLRSQLIRRKRRQISYVSTVWADSRLREQPRGPLTGRALFE